MALTRKGQNRAGDIRSGGGFPRDHRQSRSGAKPGLIRCNIATLRGLAQPVAAPHPIGLRHHVGSLARAIRSASTHDKRSEPTPQLDRHFALRDHEKTRR